MGKKSRERRERYRARAQAIIDQQEFDELLDFRSFHQTTCEGFMDYFAQTHDNTTEFLKNQLKRAVPIRANNVLAHCGKLTTQQSRLLFDNQFEELGLFNVFPQFESAFIDFGNATIWDGDNKTQFSNTGALVVFLDDKEWHSAINISIYGEKRDEGQIYILGAASIWVKDDGSIHGYPHIDKDYEDVKLILALVYPALLTLQFLNCKNVETIDREPTPRIKSLSEKHGIPVDSYKVLKVHTTRKVYQNGDTESDSADLDPKRLHIVRGNFATYTDEAPLFGKLTGTFWRPAHVRGDEQKGVLIKDYEIEVDSN